MGKFPNFISMAKRLIFASSICFSITAESSLAQENTNGEANRLFVEAVKAYRTVDGLSDDEAAFDDAMPALIDSSDSEEEEEDDTIYPYPTMVEDSSSGSDTEPLPDLIDSSESEEEEDENNEDTLPPTVPQHLRHGTPIILPTPRRQVFQVPGRETLRARARFVVNKEVIDGVVGLDSFSNQTLIARGVVGRLLEGSQRLHAEVCGGIAQLGQEATFTLQRQDGRLAGPFEARVAHNGINGHLPRGCVALFSLTLIRTLGIDLNWHQDHALDPVTPWLHARQ